jgi:DNA-binding IclR family transcriptional regulator
LSAIAFNDVHTIDEISFITEIPRSSVHRILNSLIQENIVTQIPKKGYVVTPQLASIGLKGLGQKNIIEVAIPIMKDLSQKTHETVSLQVISGNERVCICRFEGDYPITRHIKVGDKGPLMRGAAGKIIAAGLRDSELDSVMDQYIQEGKIRAGENASIFEELKRIREQGFAISTGERIPGSASIGVPVKDTFGNTQSSLSISTVLDRLTEKNKKDYLKLLFESANQIRSQIIW